MKIAYTERHIPIWLLLSDAVIVCDGIEKEPRTATFNSKVTARCLMDSVMEINTALGEKGADNE